jgi:hypothetical protein
MLSKPPEDKFFNDTALNIISKHYDLAGAVSGKAMKPQRIISPRMGFNYRLPKHQVTIRGGAGIFSGHIVNVWGSNIYSNGIGSIDINPQQNRLNFIADPYQQPTPQSLNIDISNAKGELDIIDPNFKFPSVLKSSITIEKKLKTNWTFSVEGLLTNNMNEVVFRSVNMLPPLGKSALPDSRNVYSVGAAPIPIPLRANGKNPYTQIYLLTNNHEKRGSAYSLSFIVDKQVNNFSFNSSYTYGRSKLLFELTGTTTPISNQWAAVETVNGRNFVTPSISDNDMQHRITAWVSKKINYAKSNAATTLTLFYNGQSGNPYSYVYNGSMTNDFGTVRNFDLIYIPSVNDLATMTFVPITGSVPYSPQQQKDLLNSFIERDKYLKEHRGQFSERNGARLPFTHIIDLRLQQDFKIKMKSKSVGFTVTYDVFNFTNMLNKNWGRNYIAAGSDQFPLIRFAGFANQTTLTPQYQFIPFQGRPYSLQSRTDPGVSARWISQVGVKINLN